MNEIIPVKKAKEIFIKVFPKKFNKVQKVTFNKSGYTNVSYCVVCDNVPYQMKFAAKSSLLKLPIKIKFSKIMNLGGNYIYIDLKKGITIRNWIVGRKLPEKAKSNANIKHLHKVFAFLKQVHDLPQKYYKYFSKIQLYKSKKYLSTLPKQYKDKYFELLNKYKNDKYCISKIDCTFNNIIVDKNGKYHFIDHEWVQLAPEYWDYGEIMRLIYQDVQFDKLGLDKFIKNFNLSKLKDYTYMAIVYNYLWTFRMDCADKLSVINYRKRLKKAIFEVYKKLD